MARFNILISYAFSLMRFAMRFVMQRALGTLFAVILAVAVCAPAWAQLRSIPPIAKRGELRPAMFPVVNINGEPFRMAPGALIFDTNNRTILYGYLPESADVAYTQDQTGLVMRIYLLTPQERERLDQRKQ
jgi:hypothetical protein